MRSAVFALMSLLIIAPGCATYLAHGTAHEWAPARAVDAVRVGPGEYHVRVQYGDEPPRAFLVRTAARPSKEEVPAVGALPAGERAVVEAGEPPVHRLRFEDGTAFDFSAPSSLHRPAGKLARAWALTPFTLVFDLATLWIQVPVFGFAFFTGGPIGS